MPRTNMSLSWGPHRTSMAYASSQDHAISHRLWLPGFGDDFHQKIVYYRSSILRSGPAQPTAACCTVRVKADRDSLKATGNSRPERVRLAVDRPPSRHQRTANSERVAHPRGPHPDGHLPPSHPSCSAIRHRSSFMRPCSISSIHHADYSSSISRISTAHLARRIEPGRRPSTS